jgi:hypothetical protein
MDDLLKPYLSLSTHAVIMSVVIGAYFVGAYFLLGYHQFPTRGVGMGLPLVTAVGVAMLVVVIYVKPERSRVVRENTQLRLSAAPNVGWLLVAYLMAAIVSVFILNGACGRKRIRE